MVSIDRDFKRKYPALLNYIRIMKRTNPFHLEHVNCIGDKLVFVLLNKKTLNISISELPVNAVDDFNKIKYQVKCLNMLKQYLKEHIKDIEADVYQHFDYLPKFKFRIQRQKSMYYDIIVHYGDDKRIREFDFSIIDFSRYIIDGKIDGKNLSSLFVFVILKELKQMVVSENEKNRELFRKTLITRVNSDIVSELRLVFGDEYEIAMKTNNVTFIKDDKSYYFQNMDINLLFNPEVLKIKEEYHEELDYIKYMAGFMEQEYLDHIQNCVKYVVDFINNNDVIIVNFDDREWLTERIKAICDNYNAEAIPWFNGYYEKKFKNKFTTSLKDTNIIYSRQQFGVAIYNIKTKEFDFKVDEEYKKIFKIKNSAKYKKAKKFVLELVENFELNIERVDDEEHLSLLDGYARFNIKKDKEIYNGFVVKEIVEIPSFFDNYDDWKKHVGNLLNKWNNIFNNYSRDQFCKLSEDRKEFIGDFLVCDILKFIEINPQGLSESTIHQGLRGLIRNPSTIKLTDNCGKYIFYDKSDIKKSIRNLLEKEILVSERIDSKNGHYYNFYLNKGINSMCFIQDEMKLKNIEIKIENNVHLTDCECVFLFNSLKNNFEISSYVKILNLLKNYNFAMIYLDELKKYFSDVPEVFVQYLGIKIETENDVILNKIYKTIFGEKIDEIKRQKID